METKEKFKDFVKSNPILLKYVKDGKMTWQQFYEIYDLYGEDKEAWKDYLVRDTAPAKTTTTFDLANFYQRFRFRWYSKWCYKLAKSPKPTTRYVIE